MFITDIHNIVKDQYLKIVKIRMIIKDDSNHDDDCDYDDNGNQNM